MSSQVPESSFEGRGLLRSSSAMALGTSISRVTGVLRDTSAAIALGFFLVADAFSLANSLPTILYILVIGGSLNAVFVPQLVRRMKEDPDGGREYANRLLTITVSGLVLLTVVAVLCADWIIDLYTPDNYPVAEFNLAVAFARLCLPQILFYGLYTMLSQILNARNVFGWPMFAPIANNVIGIATFLGFTVIAGTSAAADGVLTPDQVLFLGVGTTLGVVAQAVILIPVLIRAGFRWRWSFRWAGLGRTGSLAAWTLGLVLVNQVTNLVVIRLAARANVEATAAGAVNAGFTTYQKAHLIFLLPHSIITVSLVTALLPALARTAHDGGFRTVGMHVGQAMRIVTALMIPVAAILAVCGTDLAIAVFGYGAATIAQASVLGNVVSVFMIGLIPFTLFYVMLRGFYAIEDTRTPFLVSVIFSVVWMGLALPIFSLASPGGNQIQALALAYGLAYWLACGVTWLWLRHRLGTLDSRRTGGVLIRLAIVGFAIVVTMLLLRHALSALLLATPLPPQLSAIITMTGVGLVGALLFVALAHVLRVSEVSSAIMMVRRKVVRR